MKTFEENNCINNIIECSVEYKNNVITAYDKRTHEKIELGSNQAVAVNYFVLKQLK